MDNPLKYTCLFGGGAIRGLAYVGTLRALEELGVEFDIIGGSSVGSIFATLVACGYKSYELENLFMKVNFELFRDIHLGFGKGIALSKGEIFVDWLNELIVKKLEDPKKKTLNFDELEKEMHPMLFELIVSKFQSKTSNPNNAQLIFTTHNTELLNMELIRKDQIYFADKRRKDGSSSLYSISEFATPTTENVRKGYLMGKYGATPDIEIEEVE